MIDLKGLFKTGAEKTKSFPNLEYSQNQHIFTVMYTEQTLLSNVRGTGAKPTY